MKERYGDLIDLAIAGEFDVIVHGCNCFCTMGNGIAKSIKHYFPMAYIADAETTAGDKDKLGTYSSAVIELERDKRVVVVNAYTQYGYRRTGRNADYEAIERVFAQIKHDFTGKRIGYPLIGAGLAGGDWSVIADIINAQLDQEDHTLVRLEREPAPQAGARL